MNSSTTLYWRRGAVLGLALLFCVQSAAQDDSALTRDILRREYRGHSYILVETDGAHEVLIIGNATDPSRVMHIDKAEREQSLYDLVERDGEYAIPRLVLALGDDSSRVRQAAVRLLAEIDTIEARMILEGVLAYRDIDLRVELVEAIADAPGTDELLQIASTSDVEAISEPATEYLAERLELPEYADRRQ